MQSMLNTGRLAVRGIDVKSLQYNFRDYRCVVAVAWFCGLMFVRILFLVNVSARN